MFSYTVECFEALDGKVFETKKECEEHEEQLIEKLSRDIVMDSWKQNIRKLMKNILNKGG